MTTKIQKTARQLALRALATGTQVGLKLPIEVLDIIFSIHVEDDCGVVAVAPDSGHNIRYPTIVPYNVLTTCKLFYDITIPHLYRALTLSGTRSYIEFLRTANFESFKYIRKVTFHHVMLATPRAVKGEIGGINCLQKRAALYVRHLERVTKSAVNIWPRAVEFELLPGRDRRGRVLQTGCLPRMLKLFHIGSLSISGGTYRDLLFTFDPAPAGYVPLRMAVLNLTSTSPNRTVFLERDSALPTTCWHRLRDEIDTIKIPASPPAPTHHTQSLSYLVSHIFERQVREVRLLLSRAKVAVVVTTGPNPHIFCGASEQARSQTMDSRLILECCEGDCHVEKSLGQKILNRFFRGVGKTPEEVKAEILTLTEDDI